MSHLDHYTGVTSIDPCQDPIVLLRTTAFVFAQVSDQIGGPSITETSICWRRWRPLIRGR
jgi:hypothetical protein